MAEEYPDVEESIKSDSAIVDGHFIGLPAESLREYSLSLPVPSHHPRAKHITETRFVVGSIESIASTGDSYYLIDSSLRNTPIAGLFDNQAHYVDVSEGTLKEVSWLDSFIKAEVPPESTTIVGIGGGILLNAAAFVAEKTGADFVSVPTTVLAAADSAIGGLIRINKVDGEKFQKSFYKSVYEPSTIILDLRLLATLPKEQISFGLSEVIKHGVYQSMPLLEYLASDTFDPLNNEDDLLKAICWTAALKNVAIMHDPDSESYGGDILRGGHKLALTIEEESHFRISHGQAVAVGVYQDTVNDTEKLALLDAIYLKLSLPKAQSNLVI